ncbi:ChaN family lipoprotein [Noviherbaspirillum sp. ST9]|uniref:ChaN family lipoprotein n=1 Tax=Noviherbaspirillum sp. ST9 TaxID=3401606 RepID=UPI003B58684A
MNHFIRRILPLAFAAAIAAPLANAAPAGCLTPAAWTQFDKASTRTAPSADIVAEMAKRDVVLLGEYHDEDDHHRWQVQMLSALHVLRPNMVIGFEMFPRRVQPVLDRWVKGELTLKQFLEQAEWDKVWNTPPDLYVPLFQFARINRIPMVALNVDNKLNKAIREKGWDQVPEAEREGVGRAAGASEAYRDYLFDVFGMHAGVHGAKGAKPSKTDPAFVRFVESQITWDRAMAEALAGRVKGSDKPLAVGIVGSGHLRFGYGIPHQLRDLGINRVGTLVATPADTECKDIPAGIADAVFALPLQSEEKPEPPRLGVRLEDVEGGVRLSEVTAGSLAERTGLKVGDRLLEIAGIAVGKAPQVAASVRRQPPGTWLPMRIKRGEELLDIVVKFPVKQ